MWTGIKVTVQPMTVRIHEQEQALYFPLEKKPDFISFDIGNHYTKTVKLEYPLPELKAQLQHDPDPLSRIFAAEAIAQKGGLEAVKALAQALSTDPFWGVRAEVAEHGCPSQGAAGGGQRPGTDQNSGQLPSPGPGGAAGGCRLWGRGRCDQSLRERRGRPPAGDAARSRHPSHPQNRARNAIGLE
jgi:hypothetical protein